MNGDDCAMGVQVERRGIAGRVPRPSSLIQEV